MKIWRISNHEDLSGIGGTFASGRWNHLGSEIVYCSDHPSTCLLELLVRLNPDVMPTGYQLLEIDISDSVSIDDAKLPDDWETNVEITRDYWQDFQKTNHHAILKVPSVLLPQSFNFLLNPKHPDHSGIRIVEAFHNIVDERFYF